MSANAPRLIVTAALGLVVAAVGARLVVLRHRGSGRPASRPAVIAAEAPRVDVDRERLGACGLEAVSFRTRDEGWVTDACGHAFHTSDGGVTFTPLPADGTTLALAHQGADDDRRGHVGRIEWISAGRAVAFGYGEGNVLSTSDGGRSWRRAPLRDGGGVWISASTHVGESVWACGSSGGVFRSRDGGGTFARTARTPFNDDDRCMALSFVDDQLGWAGGMSGTLFETRDGGERWRRLRAPRRGPPTGATFTSGAPVYPYETTGVWRLSADEGWVVMSEESNRQRSWTYFTADGGASWIERPAPEDVAVGLAGGSRWGEGRVVAVEGGLLRFTLGGELVRTTPLVQAKEHLFETVRGREPLEPGHLGGFTDHALVESFDDGRSWSTVARVADGRIRRAVRADGDWLVELADGRLVTPRMGGGAYGLAPSIQPAFDRFRMMRVGAHRQGLPAPPGPLAALAAAPEGRLEVRLAKMGCDGGGAVDTRLVWTAERASLTLADRPPVALAPEARQQLLRRLAAAVEVPDDAHHGCTTELSAALTWRAGAAAPENANFSESDCQWQGEPAETGPAHRVRDLLLSPPAPWTASSDM